MTPFARSSNTILLGALCALVFPAQAADRIAGGKWEAAMTTDGETRTVSFCVSAAEAASINGDSKSGREFAEKKAGGRCAINAYEIKGDTVSYSLVCGDRTITDKTAFHGETSEGVKSVTFQGKTIATTVKSHRIGAC
jgi:hypothetical protein